MDFIDIQAGFGGFRPGRRELFTASDLVCALKKAGIAKALARITPDADDFDMEHSNAFLYEQCKEFVELLPCPAVAPDPVGDLGGAEHQISQAIEAGACAAVLRPLTDYWTAEPWACRDIMTELAAGKLPAFVSEKQIQPPQLGRLAAAFPETRFIYGELNYRALRTYIPMMQEFPNIFLSTGCNFNFHAGLPLIAEKTGTDRLLFGSGLPVSEPCAAISELMYSGLGNDDICKIASGNFSKLMKEINR